MFWKAGLGMSEMHGEFCYCYRDPRIFLLIWAFTSMNSFYCSRDIHVRGLCLYPIRSFSIFFYFFSCWPHYNSFIFGIHDSLKVLDDANSRKKLKDASFFFFSHIWNEALESRFLFDNLHKWKDLVLGKTRIIWQIHEV